MKLSDVKVGMRVRAGEHLATVEEVIPGIGSRSGLHTVVYRMDKPRPEDEGGPCEEVTLWMTHPSNLEPAEE